MKNASASCPTCDTLFERLPVEYDEDGGYAFLEVHPCAGCGKMLCTCCDQFHCDGCGETFCADHLVSVPDGTERPLHCCEACADESKPLCPVCDEHADMWPQESTTERWYECAACHAKFNQADIDAANPEPLPACMVRFELVMQARTVGEVVDVVRAHEASGCPICGAMRETVTPIPAQRETRTAVPRLAA
jgi:hypothetical protein